MIWVRDVLEVILIWVLSWGYIWGALPFILGIIGAIYFRPCNFGLC
jgi:hypothetical protein